MKGESENRTPAGLIPAKRSTRFFAGFAWYARRLLKTQFNAVRLTPGARDALASLDDHKGPALVALSHASWWDPILCVVLARTLHPSRTPYGPIDAHELRKFVFMRRLGLFGLDPDDPSSLDAMRTYLDVVFEQESRPTVWITPQGRFTDPREPIRLRPGAATVASGAPGLRAVTLSAEYTFWEARKPELLVHASASPVQPGSTSTTHRALERSMQRCADELAELSIARDASAFVTLFERAGAVNPAYDLFLRLRGKSARIDARRRAESAGAAL